MINFVYKLHLYSIHIAKIKEETIWNFVKEKPA